MYIHRVYVVMCVLKSVISIHHIPSFPFIFIKFGVVIDWCFYFLVTECIDYSAGHCIFNAKKKSAGSFT